MYLCRNSGKRYNYHVFVQIVLSGDKDMNDALVYILEMIGTVAFAWSGAMVGIRKNLDIFGVIVLGVVTAVGGGVCRDLLLGITPPNMFLNPAYALVAFATALSGVQYLPFFCAAVAAAFMGLMLRVVKNVMENAVELKTENELTI